jgi:nitrogen-specific signal transduction histidine kinase
MLKPLLDIEHLGTELNIPISHKIIEAHDGRLDIRSVGNVDSFIISLPIAESRDAAVPSEGGHRNG